MYHKKSLVKNAADHKQVKEATKKEKSKRHCELKDLALVLREPYGRRVLWRLLSKCQTFGSIWEPSAKIHYNAGQQDLGHFIMAEIEEADQDALFLMMKEAKKEIENGN